VQISITEAKGHLTALARRAEAGEDVVLTRHGKPSVRLVPIIVKADRKARRTVLDAVRQAAYAKAASGLSAARSQDFLYDDDGLSK
jgi:prevent-host-death family protein